VQELYDEENFEEEGISSYGINDEEIAEYAKFLGMDPDSSKDA
jgi:hypothetical protein